MINRLIAISLLLALISSNLSRFVIYAEFKANQKYIASVLCENLNKPEKHCYGKCYLAKKIKQAEDHEKKQERNAQKQSFQDCFLLSQNVPVQLFSFELNKVNSRDALSDLPQVNTEVLHPPPASPSIS